MDQGEALERLKMLPQDMPILIAFRSKPDVDIPGSIADVVRILEDTSSSVNELGEYGLSVLESNAWVWRHKKKSPT